MVIIKDDLLLAEEPVTREADVIWSRYPIVDVNGIV
jgi:hypothetical protein